MQIRNPKSKILSGWPEVREQSGRTTEPQNSRNSFFYYHFLLTGKKYTETAFGLARGHLLGAVRDTRVRQNALYGAGISR